MGFAVRVNIIELSCIIALVRASTKLTDLVSKAKFHLSVMNSISNIWSLRSSPKQIMVKLLAKIIANTRVMSI